jgi:endonuclease/exonuclease/phosphatase family metal-dependent hydrolase
MNLIASILLAAITVCTWNGKWFPSGRAEHRASPEREAQTIADAGRMLRNALKKMDPEGTNDLIFCFNEIRSRKEAEALCEAIGRKGLKVVAVSGYRRRDRFDMQQDVVATTLPVANAGWSRWKRSKDGSFPPRGCAYASVVVEPSVTAMVYSVHLKSNYGQGRSKKKAAYNRSKRIDAVSQLMAQTKKYKRRVKNAVPVIIAGDFNADKWADVSGDEKIFDMLEKEGYKNVLDNAAPENRQTYGKSGRFKGAALDYVMLRGFEQIAEPKVFSAEDISDHNPLFVNIGFSVLR